MVFYPGGTWWDKTTRGHRFWENFLCDLLHSKSLSGMPNLMSARLAEVGMLALVIGIVSAFSLAPEVIPSRRRLGKWIGRFGAVGALLLSAAPLLPSDRHPVAHSLAVVLGTLPALLAFAGLVGAILVEPVTPVWLRGTSLLLLVLLVLCLAIYAWDVYFNGPSLKLLPGLERVATLVTLVWLLLLGRFVRYRLIQALQVLQARAKAESTAG